MSRSWYTYDAPENDKEQQAQARHRAAVSRAIKGKRGQAFLKEMLLAMDAMPVKRLEDYILSDDTGCCAMGAVAESRGLNVSNIDPEDRFAVAAILGIAASMVQELAYYNDEAEASFFESAEQKFVRMRRLAIHLISTPEE